MQTSPKSSLGSSSSGAGHPSQQTQSQQVQARDLSQLRYQYQGQAGFDASKTMAPSPLSRQQADQGGSKNFAPDPVHANFSGSSNKLNNSSDITSDKTKEDARSKKKRRLYVNIGVTVLFSLVLTLASLGSALSLVAFTPTNAELIAYTHADFSPEEIHSRQIIAAELLRYVVTLPFETASMAEISQEDLDIVRQWSMGEYEKSHLSDVRILLGNSLLLGFVLTIASIVIITLFRDKQFVRYSLLTAGIASIALPLILLVCVIFFFDQTFVIFHEIFFPQGNWYFAPETLLISTLPETYWQTAGILWMGIFFLNGLILTALSRFCGELHTWSVTND